MRLPTFNSDLGRMIRLLSFLIVILSIPMASSASGTSFSISYLNGDECEESASLLLTPNDTYTSLGITNVMCLNNATTPTDGQFVSTIEIEGESNTVWYIDDAIGYYDPAFQAPGDPPTPYTYGPLGALFTEGFHPHPDSSIYTLDVLTIHGESNLIRLRSNKDDIVTLIGQGPKYDYAIINGPISLCTNSTVSYSVNGYPPPYNWTISGGGVFVSDTKSSQVTVEWGGGQGTFQLTFNAPGADCIAPTILDVTLGALVPSEIKCMGDINVSLPDDCTLEILPQHLILGPPNPGAPYAVMLTDEHDNLIPNATLTYEHIGMNVKAKLIDGCSNNSCWSWILVEDKLPPEIVCEDVTISCHQVAEYEGPFATDNCTHEVDLRLINEETEMLDCDDNFGYIISRTYVAVDASGNVSEECDVDIYVSRVELDSIKFPANRMRSDMTNLTCNNYHIDENGFPLPAETGVPTLGGVPVWPNADPFCNIYSSYSDVLRKPNDCTKKVMRTWRIYEWWCGGVIDSSYTQVIEIADIKAPVVTCPVDLTVNATVGDCEARVVLPSVTATDECSETFDVDIAYPGGFIESKNGGVQVTLPFGVNEIKYYVYDECRNVDSCSINITVVDKAAPVALCDQNSVVGLDIFGDGYVPASTFDDGSYDACKIDSMRVRRMDLGAPCNEPDDRFKPYVDFCCADAGKIIMVEFRVWDKAGNSNSCMVSVEVQDKFPPKLTAPGDREIECGYDFDLNDLSEFGLPTVEDACGAILTDTVYTEIDQCNVGVITRAWKATDANGFAVDTQRIFIVNSNPFNGDGMAITWPMDLDTTAACGSGDLHPDNLPDENDYPDYDEGFCDLVSSTFKDELYPFNDPNGNACYKIIRKWTVIDWCQPITSTPGAIPDPDNPRFETWVWDQVLKLRNNVAPTIDGNLDSLSVCSIDCFGGPIDLVQTGSDDCTQPIELRWEWKIDLDSDGTIDTMDSGSGANMEASDTYPIGFHKILWTYEDRCGNKTSLEQKFTVRDCNGPKAVAIDGFSIGLTGMDLTGPNGVPDGEYDDELACIWSDELDASSFHPCGIPINFSFSPDTADDKITFGCFDIGTNMVTLYVTDIFGNVDSVIIEIDVQDNNDVDICQDPRDCVIFPMDTIIEDCVLDLDPTTLNSMPIVDPDCLCDDFDITFEDDTLTTYPDLSCLYLRRTWTVTFNCGASPIVASEDQEISVFNLEAPEISCPLDIIVPATGPDCMADVILDLAMVSSTCNTGVVVTNSYNGGGADASGQYPVGVTEVVFTVTDACNNVNTCSTTVTVTDGELPTCVPQDITITLDQNNEATITAADVDGGSTDACGMIDTRVVSQTSFGCGDIGDVVVTLTVTDDSGNSSECQATVTVRDDVAPVCMTQDITIQVDDQGDTVITVDDIDNGSSDPCGSIVDRSLDRTTFNCADTGMDIIVNLTLTDDSGNVTVCPATVTVEDNVAPECLVQDITISIDANNMVTITAADIDAGSTDACGMIVDTTLSQSVFDCNDLGINMVTYTVTDNSGNTSVCTAMVTVEDMTMPACAVQDITIYLDENGMVSITAADIDDGSSAGCNNNFTLEIDREDFDCSDIANNPTLVTLTVTDSNMNSAQCAANVTVLDTIPPTVMCQNQIVFCYEFNGDYSTIGGLTVSDNCMGSVTNIDTMILVDATNVCGIGTVTRRFIVMDAEGNIDSCDQVIDILGEEVPFDETDITWPEAMVLVEDCTASTLPGDIGSETTVDTSLDSCSMVTIEFMDNITSSGMFCGDTIERKWTVVDSCQFDGTTMAGMWMFTQTIVVTDTAAPMIVGPPDFTVTAPDGGADCGVEVDLSGVMVNDDCDPDVTVTNDSPMADSNDTGDASGEYVPGIYVITITAVDICGNSSMYTYTLTVEAPPDPGLPCIKVFASIRDNGFAVVTPADFGVTVGNDCYDPTGLVFTFDKNNLDSTSMSFDCDDVGVTTDPEGLGILTPLYAFMDGILVDSCNNVVTVIDPFSNCIGQRATEVEGQVYTVYEEKVEGVQINVSGDQQVSIATNVSGEYAFPALDYGSTLTVEPYKNDDVLNGVSTLDLLYIQRHVLGIDEIEDLHMLVAADINNNKGISIADVLELRKVLIGINDQFPENNSWRMIQSNYAFPELDNPFAEALPETYTIEHLDRRMKIDWIGVKVGDVDGTARPNSRSLGTTRSSAGDFTLSRKMVNGSSVLTVQEHASIYGLQMAVEVASRNVKLRSDLPGFGDHNYNIGSDGILRVSWNSQEAIDVDPDMHILEFVQNNIDKIVYEEALLPEVYIQDNGQIVLNDLIINNFEIKPMSVANNHPNPWVEYTDLGFEISYDDKVTIKLYDSNGRLVEQRQIDAVKGYNVTRIFADQLDASGVIFYDVISSKEKAQGKMILIK